MGPGIVPVPKCQSGKLHNLQGISQQQFPTEGNLGLRTKRKNTKITASLVALWLRIRLPMQGTRVQALVWEDPTCRGATKPVRHNYGACALEPTRHNHRAQVPQLLKPTHLEPMLHNKRSHHNEKPVHRNKEQPLLAATRESPRAATRPNAAKNKNKQNK